ncbi:MAG: hypothetical protein Q9185_005282 [Variospora sp. 1 TL-2023]
MSEGEGRKYKNREGQEQKVNQAVKKWKSTNTTDSSDQTSTGLLNRVPEAHVNGPVGKMLRVEIAPWRIINVKRLCPQTLIPPYAP